MVSNSNVAFWNKGVSVINVVWFLLVRIEQFWLVVAGCVVFDGLKNAGFVQAWTGHADLILERVVCPGHGHIKRVHFCALLSFKL